MVSDSEPIPNAKLPKSGRRVREVPAPSIRFHFENAGDFPMITLYFSSGGRGVRGGFSHEELSSYTA
jgi:hypothetical protein